MNNQLSNSVRDWVAVIFAMVLPTLVTFAYFVLAARFSTTVQQATYTVAKTFQFLFPVLYVILAQCRRPRFDWSSKGIGFGLLFGLSVGAVMLALYHLGLKSAEFFAPASEQIRLKVQGLDLASAQVFILVGVFYSLIHSLLEEYYWRWFVFGELQTLTKLSTAIWISALAFAAHHVLVIGTYFGFYSPLTWLFSLCVAVGGAVWAWLYNRSGSLAGPWLSHLLVDAAIFAVGYQIAIPLLHNPH